jgi:predicted acylesterase/phospholipase RssA
MSKIMVAGGGGALGLIQMVALAAKENEVGPLYKYYDLMVGTSVGAINIAALATGKISANDLLKLYPSWLDTIFKKSWNPFKFPRYDRQNFINIWKNYFGTMKMKECLTKIEITSVDICSNQNNYFKSWEPEDGEEDLMSTVIKSFAAPVFFGQIVDDVNRKVFFDGGTTLNNLPVVPALMESILLQWMQKEIITFDVFGTGYIDEDIPFDQAKDYKWLRQALDFMDIGDGGLARSQSREDQIGMITKLAQTIHNIKFNYWDVLIDKKYSGIDNTKNKDKLLEYGNEMARKPLISITSL